MEEYVSDFLKLLSSGAHSKREILNELELTTIEFNNLKNKLRDDGYSLMYNRKTQMYQMGGINQEEFSNNELLIRKFANETKLNESELEVMLNQLKNPERKHNTHRLSIADHEFDTIFSTDYHLGHNKYRGDAMTKMHDTAIKNDISTIFNSGDTIEGMSGREGHVYELDYYGLEEQVDFAAEELQPFADNGIEILSIEATNSHTGWYNNKGNNGVNAGRILEERVKAYTFLGWDEQTVKLDSGLKIGLRHPGGGTAYAISYKMQKYVESISGGQKPHLINQGHFHKINYMFYRNIHAFDAGCFEGKTKVITDSGKKMIRDVVVGDKVLTHKGRYKKVTELFTRMYNGEFYRIFFGRGDEKCAVTCTKEHPFLVIRNNKKDWVMAKELRESDKLFVRSISCKNCDTNIPYWRTSCTDCIEDRKTKMQDASIYKSKGGNNHYKKDILPRALELQKEGYKVIPIGDVVPDIVAYKNGKLIAIEIEDSWISNGKKKKYDGFDFPDEVRWELINRGKPLPRFDYDKESGFCIVNITKIDTPKRRNRKVYNLHVEKDNSYVAGNVVVHNCFQDQTIFLKKKSSPAHVGFWRLKVFFDKEQGVERLVPEMVPFYE